MHCCVRYLHSCRLVFFFFSSRRRHTSSTRDWSSDVCSSDLPGETADDYRDIGRLHPLLAPWTKQTPVEALEIVRIAEYTFRARLADRWRDRRVFLLGDAAHLTPPFIGQGLGAGLRDAVNLAWKLAGVLDGTLPPHALDSYEAERKPHARAMILLAKLIGVAMTQGGRAGNL